MYDGQEDRLEVSEIGRTSSVSEGKPRQTDEDLGSEVEGADRVLDSSLYEMVCANEEEIFSEWRVGMIICLSCKTV